MLIRAGIASYLSLIKWPFPLFSPSLAVSLSPPSLVLYDFILGTLGHWVYKRPKKWIIAAVWLKLDFESGCGHVSSTRTEVLKVKLRWKLGWNDRAVIPSFRPVRRLQTEMFSNKSWPGRGTACEMWKEQLERKQPAEFWLEKTGGFFRWKIKTLTSCRVSCKSASSALIIAGLWCWRSSAIGSTVTGRKSANGCLLYRDFNRESIPLSWMPSVTKTTVQLSCRSTHLCRCSFFLGFYTF